MVPKQGLTIGEQNYNAVISALNEINLNKKKYAELFVGMIVTRMYGSFSLKNVFNDFENFANGKIVDEFNNKITQTSFNDEYNCLIIENLSDASEEACLSASIFCADKIKKGFIALELTTD